MKQLGGQLLVRIKVKHEVGRSGHASFIFTHGDKHSVGRARSHTELAQANVMPSRCICVSWLERCQQFVEQCSSESLESSLRILHELLDHAITGSNCFGWSTDESKTIGEELFL
jgi:hypothetical protein